MTTNRKPTPGQTDSTKILNPQNLALPDQPAKLASGYYWAIDSNGRAYVAKADGTETGRKK